MVHVGIDEVGYGPRLGPLVVVAVVARGVLRCPYRVADSKKVFSQARGVGSLQRVVLGYLPAATFADLLERLSTRLPQGPWYRAPLPLPEVPRLEGLEGAYAQFIDPAEFNAQTQSRNKSDYLFDLVAGLVERVRRDHAGPMEFYLGKQGGRTFYLEGIRRRIDPEAKVHHESPARSTYEVPGAVLSFLKDAEDHHELVALASMVGKYLRECAMGLFNDYWARRRAGLRRTAGYGPDGSRFYREIEPALAEAGVAPREVLRLR